MIYPIAIPRAITSPRDLNSYLDWHRLDLAIKSQVPENEFEKVAVTREGVTQQGCFVLDEVTLYHFLDGKRTPFSFTKNKFLPMLAILWVKKRQ